MNKETQGNLSIGHEIHNQNRFKVTNDNQIHNQTHNGQYVHGHTVMCTTFIYGADGARPESTQGTWTFACFSVFRYQARVIVRSLLPR